MAVAVPDVAVWAIVMELQLVEVVSRNVGQLLRSNDYHEKIRHVEVSQKTKSDMSAWPLENATQICGLNDADPPMERESRAMARRACAVSI